MSTIPIPAGKEELPHEIILKHGCPPGTMYQLKTKLDSWLNWRDIGKITKGDIADFWFCCPLGSTAMLTTPVPVRECNCDAEGHQFLSHTLECNIHPRNAYAPISPAKLARCKVKPDGLLYAQQNTTEWLTMNDDWGYWCDEMASDPKSHRFAYAVPACVLAEIEREEQECVECEGTGILRSMTPGIGQTCFACNGTGLSSIKGGDANDIGQTPGAATAAPESPTPSGSGPTYHGHETHAKLEAERQEFVRQVKEATDPFAPDYIAPYCSKEAIEARTGIKLDRLEFVSSPTPPTPSDTPRTDKLCRNNYGGMTDFISADFARTLERENTALLSALRGLVNEGSGIISVMLAGRINGWQRLDKAFDEARTLLATLTP